MSHWTDYAFEAGKPLSFEEFSRRTGEAEFVQAFQPAVYNALVAAIAAKNSDPQIGLAEIITEQNALATSINPVQPLKISRCCGNDPPTQGMLELLKTGGYAAAKWALAGFNIVSKEEQNRRLDLCEQCDKIHIPAVRCTECGCYVKVKAWMETEHCPLEKW